MWPERVAQPVVPVSSSRGSLSWGLPAWGAWGPKAGAVTRRAVWWPSAAGRPRRAACSLSLGLLTGGRSPAGRDLPAVEGRAAQGPPPMSSGLGPRCTAQFGVTSDPLVAPVTVTPELTWTAGFSGK